MFRLTVRVAMLAVIMMAMAMPAAAQSNVAVIDVQRVVTESDPGKEVMQKLRVLSDAKAQEGQTLQQELAALQDQFNKQRFTVSEQRQAEMSKEIEDKQISIRRFQDDAQRELQDAQRRELGGLEERILPIINQVGQAEGYTLIFNKFQSGLVYADEAVDVTDRVITMFNTAQ
ncbi:MAG: OmpH family outer membrane protein [Thermoanaerobaculales bacterium]|jgi:outer membrane protein|nr:OmpH family outer membrane protein [Thermoanaerobaculales bacterium]